MRIILRLCLIVLLGQSIFAQSLWMWNQRTHPELKWQTLETDHFNIHFHQGLDSIAHKGAMIAEQSYQPILDQLEMQDFGKTDIIFSAEDEILNGFAMPTNQIFIWVSQNDVAGRFGGSDKWLKLVVTHEFQHVVQFQAQRTWLGLLGAITIPPWWLEGMAEYMTEVWRVGRSDARMKIHTYTNTMDKLDPHDDGYAKVLYLASKYGDSTLVKIAKHRLYLNEDSLRYPYWYDFKTAFKAATNQSVENFDEEWRRAMNAYYYGYMAQKERIEEIGEPQILHGFSSVQAASLSQDSTMIAVLGRRSSTMHDYGLYTMTTDSNRTIKEVHYGRFSGNPAWSPDAGQIVVPEYHRGSHGSLIYDLRLVDVESGKVRWITRDIRALHPVFSKNGKGIFFVAHPGETSQIYYQSIDSGNQLQISKFEGDIQIQNLDLSPDGKQLAFMIQEENGDVNIAIMKINGEEFKKVTNDPEEDLNPVWTADGNAIVFTSFRNSTPNLYRVSLDSLTIIQMTDVGEGIFSQQRLPGTDKILASTLATVDTVRIRAVDAARVAPELTVNLREPFVAWRTQSPGILVPEISYDTELDNILVHPYRARKTFRPLLRWVWPDIEGLFGLAAYNDALGKHLIQGGGVINWKGKLSGGYLGYTNLEHAPAINFYATKNFSFNMRRTWGATHFEVLDGAGLRFLLPMNSGNSLSSNHNLDLHLRMVNRKVMKMENSDWERNSLFMEKAETSLGVTWSWKHQRPERDAVSLPGNGWGLLAHAETTLPQIWGDADYSKIWMDGYVNIKIPHSPFVFYNRSKWEYHDGDILSQDSIGFMSTAPLYFSPGTILNLVGQGIIDLPESYNLRGQTGEYPASEILYNVTELRVPLLKAFPAHFLGFGFTGITGALFHDLGYLPETGETLTTMGAELKFNLSIGRVALLTLSAGVGGDQDYWTGIIEESAPFDLSADHYLRLALVNPF
ncbi:MAG: hypothetical protein K9N35_05950 [Candidatus Marinimicrobia bacterium]|nr:hypothetical protein [Candidatus Neomarinimicrobiota bacterium]